MQSEIVKYLVQHLTPRKCPQKLADTTIIITCYTAGGNQDYNTILRWKLQLPTRIINCHYLKE